MTKTQYVWNSRGLSTIAISCPSMCPILHTIQSSGANIHVSRSLASSVVKNKIFVHANRPENGIPNRACRRNLKSGSDGGRAGKDKI